MRVGRVFPEEGLLLGRYNSSHNHQWKSYKCFSVTGIRDEKSCYQQVLEEHRVKSTLILPHMRVWNYSIDQHLSNCVLKLVCPSLSAMDFINECCSIFLDIKNTCNIKMFGEILVIKQLQSPFSKLICPRNFCFSPSTLFWVSTDIPWNTMWKTL